MLVGGGEGEWEGTVMCYRLKGESRRDKRRMVKKVGGLLKIWSY